jgi:hypothetical protein
LKYTKDNFLKPVNSKITTLENSKKTAQSREIIKLNISEVELKEPVVSEVKLEESTVLNYQNDVGPYVKDNVNISTSIDSTEKIGDGQQDNNDLRDIASLIVNEQKTQKNRIPHWAKLAIASTYPNNYAGSKSPSDTLKTQQAIRFVVDSDISDAADQTSNVRSDEDKPVVGSVLSEAADKTEKRKEIEWYY